MFLWLRIDVFGMWFYGVYDWRELARQKKDVKKPAYQEGKRV